MITLRPYQQGAVEAVYEHLRTRDDNPCIVIPTAGGKTPILATICRDAVLQWQGRVLILAHVKELLEQAADKLQKVCPEVPYGIYSAGLKRRDTDNPVIVAGIQSVYRRAAELDAFDLILVDEAHLIPPDGEGMYRTFLADARIVNPAVRVIGLTATPYRMSTGPICTPDGILNHVCYEVGVRELVVQGYLCRPVSRLALTQVDTSDLHVRGGEFIADEVEHLMDTDELVDAAVEEIVRATETRNACLIFASGVSHAQHVARVFQTVHGLECGLVFGETPAEERSATLARFKAGGLKYLANVNVLTTGFDAPNIDCVALLRPTLSPGLYYQMVGRGFRIHPGKEHCLVLDFGGNILRHGPVDQIRTRSRRGDGPPVVKECPECHTVVLGGVAACPECGYEWPPPEPEPKHAARPSKAAVLSSDREKPKPQRCEVTGVSYSVHKKRGAPDDAPRTLRVDYQCGQFAVVSEWVCIEHEGFAWEKACTWWRTRSRYPVPETAARAVQLAEAGFLASTLAIWVVHPEGERFERITDYELGPIPDLAGMEVPTEQTPGKQRSTMEILDDFLSAQDDTPPDDSFAFGANNYPDYSDDDIPF